MRAIVTGGCGFIGSHLIRKLVDYDDCELIINLDLLTYSGHYENCDDVISEKYLFEYGSINDKNLFLELLKTKNITTIFHLAAESHVDRSINSIEPFISTNIDGTRCILEAIVERKKEGQIIDLIHISTDEVYGSLEKEDLPFTELCSVKPRNPYAATKAASDHLVLAFVNTYDISAVITRCSNNYGPRQFPEKLIPLMILNAMEGKFLPIYGDGKQVRDWIHVSDHVNGIIASYEGLKKKVLSSGEIINFGGDTEKENIEIVNKIIDIVGASLSQIKYVEDRLGHDRRYAMNSLKAKEKLGWEPIISWEEGLKNTIRWYLDNEKWVDSITSGEYRNWIKKQYKL